MPTWVGCATYRPGYPGIYILSRKPFNDNNVNTQCILAFYQCLVLVRVNQTKTTCSMDVAS